MIYVLEIEDRRWIKIGYTGQDDVATRIAQLQTGNPYEIRPVMTVDGSLADEQSLHGALRQALLRLRLPPATSEWYPGRHQFMRQVMLELRFGGQVAAAFAETYADHRTAQRNGDRYYTRAELNKMVAKANALPENSATKTLTLKALRRSLATSGNLPTSARRQCKTG